MKTTIDIADPLLKRAKQLARKKNVTLRAVVEEALRQALSREREPPPSATLEIRTFRGRGLKPGLAWDDWRALLDIAYEGRGT